MSATLEQAARTRPASRTGRFRADIQGLRAVAVVLVVVNHAFGWPSGGFVGVDVFYVISGYLITGLLLRELDASGSVSLRAFYARRIRRIVPAAALVLLVTVAAAFAIWFTPRALQTALDALAAGLFVSNWHFAALGTDYLAGNGAVSPLQHYWSLSIEEQFYAVWPLALLVLFAMTRGSRRWLGLLVAAALAASVVWAALRTAQDPSAAYFDTFARAWELLAGAALAIFGRSARKRPGVWAAAGLLLIVAGAVVVQTDWAVPFPWVAPAVLGTVLVIFAGSEAGPRSVLGNPVAQWLGSISYSLYLWHFPVLIFAAAIFGHAPWVGVACLPVMLGLSHLSWRLVEVRVLNGGFLKKAAASRNARPFVPRDVLVGVVALAAIFVLSLAQLKGPAPVRSASALGAHLDLPVAQTSSAARDLGERRGQIEEALAAAAWPGDVASDLDVLFDAQLPEAMLMRAPGCRNDVFQRTATLVCNDMAEPDIMVVGDSNAMTWVPTVQAAAGGRSVSAVGFANCSLIDTDVTNRLRTPGFPERCAQRRDEMLHIIDSRHPDVVVISAAESGILFTGLPLSEAGQAWEKGVDSTLNALRDVPRVIVLTSAPLIGSPQECAKRFGSPSDCILQISDAWQVKSQAERDATARHQNAVFVDASPWFCDSRGRCPAFIGGDLVKTDQSHLTDAGARAAAAMLDDVLS